MAAERIGALEKEAEERAAQITTLEGARQLFVIGNCTSYGAQGCVLLTATLSSGRVSPPLGKPCPLSSCAGQLSEAQTQAATLQSSLDTATAQAQQAEERAAGLDGELAEARQALEARQGELESTTGQLAAAQEQIAGLTGRPLAVAVGTSEAGAAGKGVRSMWCRPAMQHPRPCGRQ